MLPDCCRLEEMTLSPSRDCCRLKDMMSSVMQEHEEFLSILSCMDQLSIEHSPITTSPSSASAPTLSPSAHYAGLSTQDNILSDNNRTHILTAPDSNG